MKPLSDPAAVTVGYTGWNSPVTMFLANLRGFWLLVTVVTVKL